MKMFLVKSQQDLYALKEVEECYEEIVIDLTRRELRGLTRHAIKYSNNALTSGGNMIIKSSPFQSYVLQRDKVDFWQIKYEVFNSLKDSIEVVEVNDKEGRLVLKKTRHLYSYSGTSFGIVFSGNEQEEMQLINAIKSIAKNFSITDNNYEILVCGPSDYKPERLTNQLGNINIRYLPFDISTEPRLLICEKKNHLFKEAKYSLVVITHSRIVFSADFAQKLHRLPIEMATPSVHFQNGDRTFKYLDIGFIDTYQDIQLGTKGRTIGGENIDADYLHWYKSRVPYIDGGLNILNKNVIQEPPYNNFISWGEAEDIDICNRLFQNGILIDYLPDLKCYSATCKVTGYNNLKKIARKLFVYMNKKRILK
jgi:hypothetical protein